MYLIDELCQVAAKLFEEAAKQDWKISSFPSAIHEIYANPEDDGQTLRKLAVERAVENIQELLKDNDGDFAQMMCHSESSEKMSADHSWHSREP